jgi:hypothetical protein
MICATAQLTKAQKKILAGLIGVIGEERFDADCQRAKDALVESLRDWLEPDDPAHVAAMTPDVGAVMVEPERGSLLPRRQVVVEIWASQDMCSAAGHLVSCDLRYGLETACVGSTIDQVAITG